MFLLELKDALYDLLWGSGRGGLRPTGCFLKSRKPEGFIPVKVFISQGSGYAENLT
jgi:hypothetical protein